MAQSAKARSQELVQSVVDPMQDLPSSKIRFWVPRHKAAVVSAVRSGALSMADASKRYMLTEEEFHSWDEAFTQYGVVGLRATSRERRKVPREAVSEPAIASLHAGSSVDCVITSISDLGARLGFETTTPLPDTFEVHCKKSGRSWWVNLAWQNDRVAGVRFTNPLPPPWAIKAGLAAWLRGEQQTVSIDRIDRP
jgi:Protein of unknown function (DUF1153)